jgi:RluA family pseudouridine synthase
MCQSPLSDADQADARFVENVSCPYCFKSTEQQMQESIVKRHEAIRRLTTPLPGSTPYDNYRPLSVPKTCDGMTLLDTLVAILPVVPRTEWLMRFENRRLLGMETHSPASADQIVRAGERFVQLVAANVEPDVNADIHLLHEDQAILVLEKPAPLPMHPGGRFNRNTLQYILDEVYHPQKLRACHRLDANTTGLVVVARSRHFAGQVQPQFARGEVEKLYQVRVQGHPVDDEFACDAPISSEASTLGSREVDEESGDASRTEFRVLRRDADGTALLEARPLTGRTNQIRIHLWQLGFPVVGDPVYLPGGAKGDTQTLDKQDAPMCLHAQRISFTHPLTKQRVTYESSPPTWV